MTGENRTREQLQDQLVEMRRRIAELEAFEAESKRAEQELRKTEQYLRSLLSSMHEDIMVIGPDFRIKDINKAFLTTIGLRRNEVIGRHCYEISHGYDESCERHGEKCMLREVFETAEARSCRHQHIHSDGSQIWVDLLFSPLRDEEGNVTHVLETVRDVTDLVRAEKGLWRSQRLASIGRLAAEIAHEMNNPLTSVLTFSKLAISILEGEPPPTHRLAELQKYLSYLMSETERCVNISRGLLDFSRQSEIQIVENDIHEILERTLDILKHRADQDGIEIQTAFSTNLPALSCDFRRLQQAFMNVLWNAIEAMPGGGVLAVSTSFDPEQDQIEITIADTGAGISEDDVERIFEPFFTTKADGKGVGLGLSVAYGIISQHRGEIHVQSKVGEGTHFTIQLSPGSNDVSVEDEKDDNTLFKGAAYRQDGGDDA